MWFKKSSNIQLLFAFGHDVVAAGFAWLAAFWLRFNLEAPQPWFLNAFETLVWVVPVQAAIFLVLGLYRGIWRYASLPDLKRIFVAVGLAALSVPSLLTMLKISAQVPRSVYLLDPILLAGFMCGSRLAYRVWKEHRTYGSRRASGKPVILLGAGSAAVNLLKELARSQEWRVVGLLDDDSAKHGRLLQDARVLGELRDLPNVADQLNVEHVVIAMPSASAYARRRAVELCNLAGLRVMTVPAFDDLVSGRVTISQIRELELEDLLGREPVSLDDVAIGNYLRDQVVMVTGAGGSIGSELCRQIAHYKPGLLVLFELNEFAMYKLEQEFVQMYPDVGFACIVGDVKNKARVRQILEQYRPSVLFHAAAYKHVPLMEELNGWEAIQNNVWGTQILAREAALASVEHFVMISTDKAVNPTNVMGASKRLAEMVCQALQSTSKTAYATVRFGNVLGSTGSVIPKFHEQIAIGGPVTVTHPDVKRYFMSIPEAAQLVLQAGSMSRGGEIFVMDMGDPVRIADLARDMIRLSGYSEDDIRIVYTGLRPGEKLFEELLTDEERTLPTPHPKLRVAKAKGVEANWLDALLEWLRQDRVLSDAELRRDLRRWVPEYRPSVTAALREVPKPPSGVAATH